MTPPNNSYPYIAYIECLLNYSHKAKSIHLASGLWFADTSSHIDATVATPELEAKKGLKNDRLILMVQSKWI